MNKHEIAGLVASLTNDELKQLRDFLADAEGSEPHDVSDGQFAKSVFGGGSN